MSVALVEGKFMSSVLQTLPPLRRWSMVPEWPWTVVSMAADVAVIADRLRDPGAAAAILPV